MSLQQAPRGLRLQIGIFGRRNTGKSSLLNALAGQNAVIVSDVPGTTADPVEKAMEIPPVGPVLLIDTAGLDDDQEGIGEKRVARSRKIMDRCDIALIVSCGDVWGGLEEELVQTFRPSFLRKNPLGRRFLENRGRAGERTADIDRPCSGRFSDFNRDARRSDPPHGAGSADYSG